MALWGLEFMTPAAWAKRFPSSSKRRKSAQAGYQPDALPEGFPAPLPPLPRTRHTPDMPAPTPEIRDARLMAQNLLEASNRAANAWNKTQLTDALRSVRYWTEQVEQAAKIVAKP